MFLEMCIWWLEGVGGLERFAQERRQDEADMDLGPEKFWDMEGSPGAVVARVKPSVKRVGIDLHALKPSITMLTNDCSGSKRCKQER
jgi:hypothetical protein